MHLEILLEELSAKKVLDNLLPRLIPGDEHSYRIITYQGKPDLLKNLPMALKGYSRWIPEEYKIIVLVDLDSDNCLELKNKLESFATSAHLVTKSISTDNNFQVLNRIAIEELETWFLGDADAVRYAYPRVRKFEQKAQYRNPDSIIGALETLEKILQNAGYFRLGLRKLEAADSISKYMKPLQNRSKSFQIFWFGLNCCINFPNAS